MPKPITVSKNLESPDSKVWRLVNCNPAGFSEYLRSSKRERFRLWPQQIKEVNREELKKKRIQARNLGKSITCADEFIADVLSYRGTEQGVALVGSRGQPTLQYIFEQWLIYPFQKNKFLNFFLEPGDRGVDRKNYEVRLRGGATIKGRIQGKDGQGFNTVHPNITAWFDEVQLLSDEAVAEIHGMLGPDQKVLASGVPNGVRGSWAYRIDMNPKMGYVGDRMTRLDDPRVTPEQIEQWKQDYQGEQTSGYQQKVLGEWGTASSMTFDVDRITADLPYKEDEFPRLPPFFHNVEIRERDYHGVASLPLMLMIQDDLPKTVEKIYIHADHGISGSPTTIYVSFFDSKDGLRSWRQYMRVLLFDMQTQSQVEVFHYLADALEHQFKIKPIIGIDTTGQGGQAVMSFLKDLHPVVWVNFSEAVEFGDRMEYDEEYVARMKKNPLDNPERQIVMVKSPMKQVALPHLKKMLYTGEVRLVNNPVLWKQIENTTDFAISNTNQDRKWVVDYSGPEGDSKTYNHDLQAFEVLGAMLWHDLNAVNTDLTPDMWIEPFETPWGRFS